ncbi:hypothetical protein [Pseudooceanicola sp.]|uniref:hypothetical protein n=1 Tax=Pseudooceanicola sp. TaxID=1914328 RepID=UPI002636694C|nr:hypothetical protein [Pseudooceanicola sp.]MDF1857009.1 hypothetical protein [Pseudooceanicola sp.]
MNSSTPPAAPEGHGSPYTAIVHFHGMGSQRRYEEPCRLVDSIDRYLSHAFHDRDQNLGRLVGIKPVQEPHRQREGEVVTYIRTEHLRGRGQQAGGGEVRVYECYWAPAMAGSRSPIGIAKWMVAQVLRPIYSMLTPWWERRRLRESMLLELRQCPQNWPEGVTDGDFDRMLRLYARFMRVREVREQGRGYYRHFSALIARGLKAHPEVEARMQRLARAWWWHAVWIELRNAFVLITLLLLLLLSAGGIVWSILRLLDLFAASASGGGPLGTIASLLGDRIKPTLGTALTLAASLASLIGVSRFLNESMGDVQAWATYAETDTMFERRHQVLDMGSDIIRHVLADPACTQALISSHSLGTSVAYDTLSALSLHNRAHNRADPISGPVPLDKIRHFVTMGSPIDKIHYFFGSQRSKVHSYISVLENFTINTGAVPFARNRKPHLHWVNYWDDADLIAGALHSPVGQGDGAMGVDDVHVQNYGFPAPGKSHNAYFHNRDVIGGLFRMAWLNQASYGNLPLLANHGGYDYASARLGPGLPSGQRRGWTLLALALPWLGLTALGARVAGAPQTAVTLGLAAGLGLALLVIAWIASLWRGNLKPL